MRQDLRPIRYFARDESRFGLKTLIGRLITACGIKPIGQWQWLFQSFGHVSNVLVTAFKAFYDDLFRPPTHTSET